MLVAIGPEHAIDRTPAWIRRALPPAAAVAAHAPALANGFAWLDHAHLEAGLAIAPPSGWPGLFTRGFAGTGFYRPLTSLSLSVDAALGGGAFAYHATTLGWHAAASASVALAAEALGLSRRAATLAGVLFAVHPVASIVASAIAFRSEAMVVAALGVAIAAHARRIPWLAATAILAGALAKETGLVLIPLALVACNLTPRPPLPEGPGEGERGRGRRDASESARNSPPRSSRRRRKVPGSPPPRPSGRGGRGVRLLAAELAALAIAVGLRVAFAPAFRADFPALSASEALGTRLAAFARSLGALVPVDGSICDAFPVTRALAPAALAGALVVAALVAGAARARGIPLLLALSALPVAQLVPVMRFWSPHYLYAPLAFAAMLCAAPVAAASVKRAWITPFALAALAVLGITSARSAARFRDDRALWAPEVARDSACREGHFYLGEHARARGAFADAARAYEAALAPRPGVLAYVDRAAALQNLGAARVETGDLAAAETAYREALGAAPPAARRAVTHNLAGVALARGDAAGALALLEPEIARADAAPESVYVAAKALRELGRFAESRALVERLRAAGWSGP